MPFGINPDYAVAPSTRHLSYHSKGAKGSGEHIHIADGTRQPMPALQRADVIAGSGISGDRYAKKIGRYSANQMPVWHVTLIDAEVLEIIAR